MSWDPPVQLEQLVNLAITGRIDGMIRRQRNEKSDLAERLSAHGLNDSSVHFQNQSQIDNETFDEAAQGIVGDVLGLFRDLYGEVPVDATTWIRQRLNDRLDGIAKGIVARSRRAATFPEAPLGNAKRRLEIELGKVEFRAKLRELTPPDRRARPPATRADCFICHASEDKDVAARPIADALQRRGYRVWLDETELKIGDRLLDRIDDGLANCRFGVVIVSPRFFGKQWTRRELAGLVARQDAEERTVILPVWLDVDEKLIARHLPSLAGILAARMRDGLERVIEDIVRAVGEPGPQ